MFLIESPNTSKPVARSLGFPEEQLGLDPVWANDVHRPIDAIGGRLPIPYIPVCFGPTEDDTDTVSLVKQWGRSRLSSLVHFLRGTVERQITISRDNRYSDQGRLAAQIAEWDKWIAHSLPYVVELPKQFDMLYESMQEIVRPLPARDAKEAILDADYRATVRALPDEIKRLVFLADLVRKNPDSPVLAAVLRADAFAAGISDDLHSELMMRRAAQAMPADLRGWWGAAGLLGVIVNLIWFGSDRVAAACAQRDSGLMRRLPDDLATPQYKRIVHAVAALLAAVGEPKTVQAHGEPGFKHHSWLVRAVDA